MGDRCGDDEGIGESQRGVSGAESGGFPRGTEVCVCHADRDGAERGHEPLGDVTPGALGMHKTLREGGHGKHQACRRRSHLTQSGGGRHVVGIGAVEVRDDDACVDDDEARAAGSTQCRGVAGSPTRQAFVSTASVPLIAECGHDIRRVEAGEDAGRLGDLVGHPF